MMVKSGFRFPRSILTSDNERLRRASGASRSRASGARANASKAKGGKSKRKVTNKYYFFHYIIKTFMIFIQERYLPLLVLYINNIVALVIYAEVINLRPITSSGRNSILSGLSLVTIRNPLWNALNCFSTDLFRRKSGGLLKVRIRNSNNFEDEIWRLTDEEKRTYQHRDRQTCVCFLD